MALTPKRLLETKLAVASAALYTAPPGTRTRIDAFSLVNYSAAPVTFSAWLVPTGAVADNSAILILNRSVAAGAATRVLEAIGHWIETGGGIHMSASTADAITVNVSGVEQTGA